MTMRDGRSGYSPLNGGTGRTRPSCLISPLFRRLWHKTKIRCTRSGGLPVSCVCRNFTDRVKPQPKDTPYDTHNTYPPTPLRTPLRTSVAAGTQLARADHGGDHRGYHRDNSYCSGGACCRGSWCGRGLHSSGSSALFVWGLFVVFVWWGGVGRGFIVWM